MGGQGSGRDSGYGRITVEDCISLDINELVRQKVICAGIHEGGILRWTRTRTTCLYEVNTLNMDWKYYWIRISFSDVDCTISLATTQPYFGGFRWWFMCPRCDRRMGKLHLPPNSIYFGCRHCYDLTYTSCQESHQYDRMYELIAKDLNMTPKQVEMLLNEEKRLEMDLI